MVLESYKSGMTAGQKGEHNSNANGKRSLPTNMICRGNRPSLHHFHGLTAARRAPQRVVGYRPT